MSLTKTQASIAIVAALVAGAAAIHEALDARWREARRDAQISAVIFRLQGLKSWQCNNPLPADLRVTLAELEDKYFRLTGREFAYVCSR